MPTNATTATGPAQNPEKSFAEWLGKLLQQPETEVARLLDSKLALRFLIAWSVFESKCFAGFFTKDLTAAFAKRLAASPSFDVARLGETAEHFHKRYQDKTLLHNLMQQPQVARMDGLVKKSLASFQPEDTIFFVATVVYRFRNNIFHGNKGVDTWLNYVEQIERCTSAMQLFVSHEESLKPTLKPTE